MNTPNKDIDDLHMTAKVEGDDLVIRLPLELLVFPQYHRETSILVTDKNAMGKYLQKYILEFGYDELGASEFERLIDSCFMDALENGETWLNGWWEIEDEGDEVV